MTDEAKRIANKRAQELKDKIQDFLDAKKHIVTGTKITDQIVKKA